MLKQRIIELDGVPLQSPQEWFSYTNCGYDKPVDFNTKALVEQNIKAEICAWYSDWEDFCSDWCDDCGYTMTEARKLYHGGIGEFMKLPDGNGIVRFVI